MLSNSDIRILYDFIRTRQTKVRNLKYIMSELEVFFETNLNENIKEAIQNLKDVSPNLAIPQIVWSPTLWDSIWTSHDESETKKDIEINTSFFND